MENKVCFTDGASASNAGPGGWAFLMDDVLHSGWFPVATNNQMELMAVLMAVMECPANTNLTVVTDSQLVTGWLGEGWGCQNPYTADVIESIRTVRGANHIHLNFYRVKGHSGHPQNEIVDKEAVRQSKAARYEIGRSPAK